MRSKIAKRFRQFATDIEDMNDKDFQDRIVLLQMLRADIEDGRYDTEDKEWSKENWRV